jgi:hypothetical protein
MSASVNGMMSGAFMVSRRLMLGGVHRAAKRHD